MTMLPPRGRCHTCGHDHDAEDTRLRDILDTMKSNQLAVAKPKVDVQQIIYALQRAHADLQARADHLHEMHDYSAEIPAEDAQRMLEAIGLLSATPLTRSFIPPGWVIERCGRPPFKGIMVKAPNGYVADIYSHGRNPEIVMYMLADALLSTTEDTK